MKPLSVAVCLIGLLTLAPAAAHADQPPRPNIILCMADDLGWGDTGYNGHPVVQTPHLDSMAATGLRFDRFYAAAPVCTPTRASVLTGRHPNRSTAFSWGWAMRPQEVTLAQRLRDAGYATGHFGKWHLGSVIEGSPVNPGAAGFQHWLSAYNFFDNDPLLSREGRAEQLKGESSIVTMDAAIDFIRAQHAADNPFLAVVWFGSPHVPHRAADQDKRLYEGEKHADWLGEITGIDRAMGKLQDVLKEAQLTDNTLLWFTSDNGGLYRESSGGRMRKGSIYEGGLRVPAILQWPDRLAAARTTDFPANTSDIYPTLMDLLDISLTDQPPLDGISLRPVIDGGDEPSSRTMGFWTYPVRGKSTPSDAWMQDLLAAQKAGKPYLNADRVMADAGEIVEQYDPQNLKGHAAWNDWPWKLHRIEGPVKPQPQKQQKEQGKKAVEWELYNLESDPMETTDVAEEHPERVRAMRRALEAWQTSVVHSMNGQDYDR